MVSWVLKVDGPTRFGLGWIATGFDGLESTFQEFSGSLRTGSWPARMGWVSPQGCGSGLDHRELRLVLLGSGLHDSGPRSMVGSLGCWIGSLVLWVFGLWVPWSHGFGVTGFTASTGMVQIRILGLWVARTRGLASRASRIQGCWVSGSMDPPDARSVHRKSPPVPSAFPASLPARPGSVGFELTGSSGSSGFVGWVTHGHGVDGGWNLGPGLLGLDLACFGSFTASRRRWVTAGPRVQGSVESELLGSASHLIAWSFTDCFSPSLDQFLSSLESDSPSLISHIFPL